MKVFLGIGNKFRQDDSFGLELLEELQKDLKNQENCEFINCGLAPISYLGKIPSNPNTLFLLDAIKIPELKPGETILKEISELKEGEKPVSTHRLPLTIIKNKVKPKETYLAGMKPVKMGYNTDISSEAQKAKKHLKEEIIELISTRP